MAVYSEGGFTKLGRTEPGRRPRADLSEASRCSARRPDLSREKKNQPPCCLAWGGGKWPRRHTEEGGCLPGPALREQSPERSMRSDQHWKFPRVDNVHGVGASWAKPSLPPTGRPEWALSPRQTGERWNRSTELPLVLGTPGPPNQTPVPSAEVTDTFVLPVGPW